MLRGILLSFLLQGSAPPDSLTLSDALALARARRAEVRATHLRLAESEALRRLAGRPANPTLELSSVAADETRRMVLVQPLGAIPRLAFDRRAAGALVDAMRADSAQRLANLDRDVALAYFGLVAAERRVDMLRALAVLADSLSTLAARRAGLGDISDLDRAQFALEATRVRLQLSRASEGRLTSRAALARELAWDGVTLPWLVSALTDGLASGGEGGRVVPLDELPEVRRARSSARAASLTASSLRWARLPVPGFLVQRDWSRVPGVPTLTRVGISIPVPLFTQGNEAMDAAEARARVAEAAAAEIALESERALATAWVHLEEARRRSRLASDSLVTGAVQLRDGAMRLYNAGRTSVLQVLEALRAEREAQLTAVDELLAFQVARAELAALSGRSPNLPNR